MNERERSASVEERIGRRGERRVKGSREPRERGAVVEDGRGVCSGPAWRERRSNTPLALLGWGLAVPVLLV